MASLRLQTNENGKNGYSYIIILKGHYTDIWPASVAQLDARPTGDQEVAGLIPAKVGNIL